MCDRLHLNNLIALVLLIGLVACSPKSSFPTENPPTPSAAFTQLLTASVPELTQTTEASTPPERLLTICLGYEPASLFLYDATSATSRDVLAAIYDGPVDIRNYIPYPVILEKIPALKDGDALLQPVQVQSGDMIVDSSGDPVSLVEGVEYRPSGCSETACAQKYSGDQPIQMDQLVLHFKLLAGIQWSDGVPLTSADSVYSYEIARNLFPSAQTELIGRTQSYQALDELSVEWIGLPGYQDGSYANKFFTPLPQHAWKSFSIDDLRAADDSSRKPLGWGPYIIDEWVKGDHISLHKNTLYFRANENLPHFDNLVYRFVGNDGQALDALLSGECDLVNPTAVLASQQSRITQMQAAGEAQVFYQEDAAWEQLSFGIASFDSQRTQFFALQEVRQAVAMCIDRPSLVADQPSGLNLLIDSYVPSTHPLYDPQVQHYDYDPHKAATLLDSVGWHDPDNDPATPRVAEGVTGVPDGTAFEVDYLVSQDARAQADAEAIQKMLQGCGIKTKINARQPQSYLAAGPDGPVFGRSFDLAQFAWTSALEPPCSLYLTNEIPGPFPEYARGWGGVNASGYSNDGYDTACQNALFSLPDSSLHNQAHFKAQEIYSTELPTIPLYLHFSTSVARPDLCNDASEPALDSLLWNLENFDYGSGCLP